MKNMGQLCAGCTGPSLDSVRPRALLKGQPFCGMIQTHLVRADSEELSQVILHQWNEQIKTKVRPFNF